MSPHELIKEGIFNQNKSNYSEAYQVYLKACGLGLEVLGNEPSFQMIATCREALNRAEEILKVLATIHDEQHQSKGPVSQIQQGIMVIPISPLAKILNIHSSNHQMLDLRYQAELLKSPPDLKQLREMLQEVEVEKMRSEKVLVQIEKLKNVKLYEWDPKFLAKHIAYISKSLYSQVNVGSEVLIPSLDRISEQLLRFFAFQEYLYAIMLESCAGKDNHTQTADLMVQAAYFLIFIDHDIASAITLLEVIAEGNLSKIVSEKAKPDLAKLIDLFEENTLEIHVEIIQDMVSSHPVSSPTTCIVPHLEKIVKAALITYNNTPIDKKEAKDNELLVSILEKTHFPFALADIEKDSTLQDSCLHWILSRTYLEKHNRNFWKEIVKAHRSPDDLGISPQKQDFESKIGRAFKEVALEEDCGEIDQMDEVMRRLRALKDSGDEFDAK